MSTTLEKAHVSDLAREQCIAMTTLRKSGEGVMTPVWFALGRGHSFADRNPGGYSARHNSFPYPLIC